MINKTCEFCAKRHTCTIRDKDKIMSCSDWISDMGEENATKTMRVTDIRRPCTRLTDIVCPNCGYKYLTWDGNLIYTSNPPQYKYYCESCGFSHIAYSDSAMMDWIERLDAPVKHMEKKKNPEAICDTCENYNEMDDHSGYCPERDLFVPNTMSCERHSTPPVVEDVVNHPSHYETGKFECFDVMREAFGDMAVQNFCVCNAFKYLYRHTRKNGVEDIRKAKWYIDKYLEIEDGKTRLSTEEE